MVDNCFKLFSVADIRNCVEIWRTEHAREVLKVLREIFQDISDLEIEENDEFTNESELGAEWEDVRDDSEIYLLNDTNDISQISKAMSEMDESAHSLMDCSDTKLNAIAVDASCHTQTNE